MWYTNVSCICRKIAAMMRGKDDSKRLCLENGLLFGNLVVTKEME